MTSDYFEAKYNLGKDKMEDLEESKKLAPHGFRWRNPNVEPNHGLEPGQYFVKDKDTIILRAKNSAAHYQMFGHPKDAHRALKELGYERVEQLATDEPKAHN